MQVVWSASTEVGCGGATYEQVVEGTLWYSTLFVCRYNPVGNFGGDDNWNSNVGANTKSGMYLI